MTAQPLTAHMIVLAIDMEDVAGEIRALGTDEAKQHAAELEGAAATVRQWAQACEAVPAMAYNGIPITPNTMTSL